MGPLARIIQVKGSKSNKPSTCVSQTAQSHNHLADLPWTDSQSTLQSSITVQKAKVQHFDAQMLEDENQAWGKPR
ncbi:hypothetical protein NM688_g1253 [Phlebia brevispora]|uniref:Uncharacterized protein n=1 Tax=Phlebia brevispora TaxID=194682 RepID=A0ACC1TCB8_9APHY|nr:hypothetical protein NM688_g1253 [Phlebia brevispora]